MKENDLVCGFRVVRVRTLADTDAAFYEMEHERTGAHLAWMKNSGENKLFSVAFKTLPSDDTGVFHILEHSVLCGSEKYPVREPFLEMLKSSLNTFLNAMTYPDMTVFPVSSRNDADLMNLTRVYLDAVFRPAIYQRKQIFEQEGWHTEWHKEGDEPLYKGVVFNEMKGALSSVQSRFSMELMRMLFPDNCYRFESGGDPAAIPDLTYEDFIAAHRRFYHPSNAYFFIDGPVDIEAFLSLIDSGYLSHYDRAVAAGDIPMQSATAPATKRLEYEISPDEESDGKTNVVFGKILGTWRDVEKTYAASALAQALCKSNESPLKRALLDTGHCLDVGMGVWDGILQPLGTLQILNTDEEYVDELTALVEKCARELAEDGVDKSALLAAIDRMEFRFREGSEPQGLQRNINALCAWLHGGDPLTYIDCGGVFDRLRELCEGDYYEELLREWLVDEAGRARLIMVPSHEYGEALRGAERARVSAELSALSDEGKRELAEENRLIDEWQQSADTPEALATLPVLPLSEVNSLPMRFDSIPDDQHGVTVLFHPATQQGIVTVSMYFSVADLSPDEMFSLKLLSMLLGELPTAGRTALELSQTVTSVFGDLHFSVGAFAEKHSCLTCRPFFIARSSFLEAKRDEAFALLSEILHETLFIPELIRERLLQIQEESKRSITSRGTSYAVRRVLAPYSAENSFNESMEGYEAYLRLCGVIRSFDGEAQRLTDEFHSLLGRIVCRARMTVGVTATSQVDLAPLLGSFVPGEALRERDYADILRPAGAEGIIVPSQVSFTAMSFAGRVSVEDVAAWRVLTTVLSLEYLWNEIRVRGGAYGAGAALTSRGSVTFHSFRDPSAGSSLQVYKRAADFAKEFLSSGVALDRFIIGTVADSEPLISDAVRGISADELYFRGITWEERVRNRQRLLGVTPGELISKLDVLSSDTRYAVFGPEKTVRELEGSGAVVGSI